MTRRGRLGRLLTLGVLYFAAPALAGTASVQQPASGLGRVVVTAWALEGTLRMAGVEVSLHAADGVVLAQTVTDDQGEATIPDVPPGRYIIKGARPGFVLSESQPFDVRSGEVAQVALPVSLAFIVSDVDVTAPPLPEESPQPVSTSDMLSGSVLDLAPLEGDDFQSLLPLLPGVVRGPDGRLRAKGGQPAQGALQISSTSLNDPVTGDFDVQLPGQSLESVELLANPYLAEYGRFSTSVVQLRTRRGTNEWEFNPGNFVPRFRKRLTRIRGFEPRLSVRGPLKVDRAFLAQDFQFRYVSDPVKSLPDEPTIDLTSFDSFTRLDGIVSARHSLGALVVMFPRKVEHLSMDTFRPREATPDFRQRGISIGIQDRFAWSPNLVLESTLAGRSFHTEIASDDGTGDVMIYTPQTQAGRFFNEQQRDVNSVQWVQTLTVSTARWHGDHLVKVGLDVQHSDYDGLDANHRVQVRRLDGSLASETDFGAPTEQEVSSTELALFAQDRWRVGGRLTLEFGIRFDRDDVVKGVHWSPRGGFSLAVLPDGRGILRAGIGTFRQRTPLNIAAFSQFSPRTVTTWDANETATAVTYANVAALDLNTPEAMTRNVEWNQRFARRVLLKANYLLRTGTHEYIVNPEPARGESRLTSSGTSRYSEVEFTLRYLGGDRRDINASYVHSRGTADLNSYDQFYGNVRVPFLYANEHGPIASDVPHRLLVRGTLGLPGDWTFAPVLELRSGFPWSAVDEYQMFVGGRHRAGRMPAVKTLDFSLSRTWRVWKYRFNAGVRLHNVFGSSAHRDVQQNITSPQFGQFFNPIERSIGFLIGAASP